MSGMLAGRKTALVQPDAAVPDAPLAAQPLAAVAAPVAAPPVNGRAGRYELTGDIEGNTIELGENISLYGTIKGQGNVIRIAGSRNPQKLNLLLCGHNNEITIGAGALLQSMRVEIGSARWLCSQTRLRIGSGFSIASSGRFILANSGNIIEIGDDCMFSSNIVVRAGEYPHLIFDKETGEYLDVSDGIFIGNHVWVGEGAFIGKAVTLPDDCIVGTRSVVTKRFDETHCVIAGNPARVVKRAVQWVANEYLLESHFALGQTTFPDTRVARINHAERKRAKARAAATVPVNSATAATD